jgi:hypothetical protein
MVSPRPELGVGAAQHDRLAAELAHADLERHAGACRGLLEDHGERLAAQRLVVTAVGRAFFIALP